MNVTNVEKYEKNDGWRVITVGMKRYICFSAKAADALEIGKPLPEGTEESPPKFEGAMPSLKLPFKPGGPGPAAFRNTREGFLLEQESIHRSVALKLAVKQHAQNGPNTDYETGVKMLFNFYVGLLSPGGPSSGAGEGVGHTDTAVAPITADVAPPSSAQPAARTGNGEGPGDAAVEAKGAGQELGGSTPVPKAACEHLHTSPLRPDGSEMPINKVRCLDCRKAVPA